MMVVQLPAPGPDAVMEFFIQVGQDNGVLLQRSFLSLIGAVCPPVRRKCMLSLVQPNVQLSQATRSVAELPGLSVLVTH